MSLIKNFALSLAMVFLTLSLIVCIFNFDLHSNKFFCVDLLLEDLHNTDISTSLFSNISPDAWYYSFTKNASFLFTATSSCIQLVNVAGRFLTGYYFVDYPS